MIPPPPDHDPGPLGIDVPEMSDRDREMFVLGFEYAQVGRMIGEGARHSTLVHVENMARLRALADRYGREPAFAATRDPRWLEFRLA